MLFTVVATATTKTFSALDYIVMLPTTIPEHQKDEYSSTGLSRESHQHGELQSDATWDASLCFSLFVYGENPSISIDCKDVVVLSFPLVFKNRKDSDFTVYEASMDFVVDASNEKFENDGDLVLLTRSGLGIESHKRFSNSKLVLISSDGSARVYFGEVMNFAQM